MGIDARMFVRTRGDVTEAFVKESAWLLCAVFGSQQFGVYPEGDFSQRSLEIASEIHQDGPTIKPKSGETFVDVNLCTRYWGVGYERGDLALIIGVAMWLEKRFPRGQVWYGGDSSGVCHEPFDAKARDALIAHAASKDGAAYRQLDDRSFGLMSADPHQSCEFCGPRMTPCRWSGSSVGYVCMGCGLHRMVSGSAILGEARHRWHDEKVAR